MENATTARRYVVRGRVQGVGFRWFVQREAQTLGISGWVRNNIDGNVEVIAVGSEQQLAVLAAKLKSGPRAARVDAVDESPASAENISGFRIEGAW
jgi:acylphosphatase